MVDDKKTSLQMVNNVAITAKIKQAGGKAHRTDPERADTEVSFLLGEGNLADEQITTEMSDVKMGLTAKQYVLLMDVLKALPRALSSEEEDEDDSSMPITPTTASAPPTPARNQSSDHMVNLEPELSIVAAQGSNEEAPWNAMDLVFDVGSIALEVYDEHAIEEKDLKDHSIARFALVKSHLGFKKLSDGATEAEFTLNTLAFMSTRSGKSVHRDIIPHTTQNGNQM
jgi:vacuolar protein sorting-associated protein 13A/C